MKKIIQVLMILLMLSTVLAAAQKVQAQAVSYFTAIYWIVGSVQDPDGKGTDGRQVVFYKVDPSTGFSDDLVGTPGLLGTPDRYLINASEGVMIAPGQYKVAIVKGADGYGANPVDVTVSGYGYDFAPDLILAYGAGISPPVLGLEPPPSIRVWFGNRLYQPGIHGTKAEGKTPFIVSETGTIKVVVDIEDPYQLNKEASYALSVRDPQGILKSYDLDEVSGFKISAAGAKPLVIESSYPLTLAAEEEEAVYSFTFNAASAGTVAPATVVSTQAAVTVLGGPAKIVDTPIVWPSPVRLKTDRQVTFQYTLSRAAHIEIFVFDVSGRVVKRFDLPEGLEGGSAGLNKVNWDLITDQGSIVASGIMVWTIINKVDGKRLGQGKFTALP